MAPSKRRQPITISTTPMLSPYYPMGLFQPEMPRLLAFASQRRAAVADIGNQNGIVKSAESGQRSKANPKLPTASILGMEPQQVLSAYCPLRAKDQHCDQHSEDPP